MVVAQLGWIFGSDSWWNSSKLKVVKNEWNFLVLVMDRNTGKASFYQNGKLLDETTRVVGTKPTTNNFRIGSDCAGEFKGMIDEVHIFNEGLTAFEIEQMYASLIGSKIAYEE